MITRTRHDAGRRRFLAAGGTAACAAALAGVSTRAGAGETPPAARVGATFAEDAPRILLLDTGVRVSAASLQRLGAQGARPIHLAGDPVRLWRSEQGAMLRDPHTRLLGITGWDGLLLFRGLAAETRRHLRYERHDEATGAFVWMVA